jgi:hypothetical protein
VFFCDEHSLPIASGTPVDVCWKYDIARRYSAHASILVPAPARAAKSMELGRHTCTLVHRGDTRCSGMAKRYFRRVPEARGVGIDARVFPHGSESDDF